MARNRLTWQNVAAPDYGTAVQGQAQAHRMFQDAIGGLSSSIGSYAQQQETTRQQLMRQEQEAAEAAVLRNLAGAVGNTEAQADVLRSLSGNTQVGNDFLKNIAATRNSILSGDTAATDLDQTRLTNERTNSDAALMDQFRPIAGSASAYVAKGGGNPLNAMSPEQIAEFTALPAKEQTRLIDAWSREGSQARDRSEHSLDQMAREIAFGAQASGLDGPDHAAYIYQNSPNASVAAKALEHLSRAPALLDPRGGNIPSRGTGGGITGSAGQVPEGNSSTGTDPTARQLQLVTQDAKTRSSQEEGAFPLDGLVAAGRRNTPIGELADALIAEGGAYPGASRREALGRIKQVAQEHKISYDQAAYLLSTNVNPGLGSIASTIMSPFIETYRMFGGTFLEGGGGMENRQAVSAQAGLTSSPAYRQQMEASLERQDQQGELARLEQARDSAMQRLEQASQLERVTGGNYWPIDEEENLQRLNEEIQATVAQTQNDPRFGRLIRDPDNPSNTITEGQLRQRRLEEADARTPAARKAEIKSQELQAVVQELQAEFRELLQNPGQGEPGDLARIQAELRKAHDALNKHSIKTR